MPWLLDTNHWIALLKGQNTVLKNRLRSVPPHQVWLCSVVKEELFYGAEGYANRDARLSKLGEIFARHPSVPYDDEAAAIAGRVRKQLESKGMVIGPHDLQIAAIALQHDWTVVTHNDAEFRRVAGLSVEDWTV